MPFCLPFLLCPIWLSRRSEQQVPLGLTSVYLYFVAPPRALTLSFFLGTFRIVFSKPWPSRTPPGQRATRTNAYMPLSSLSLHCATLPSAAILKTGMLPVQDRSSQVKPASNGHACVSVQKFFLTLHAFWVLTSCVTLITSMIMNWKPVYLVGNHFIAPLPFILRMGRLTSEKMLNPNFCDHAPHAWEVPSVYLSFAGALG